MFQELAARSQTAAWAIGSMLFFLALFIAIVVWVVRKHPDEMARRARMPLEDGNRDSGIRIQESGIGSQESGIGNQDEGIGNQDSGASPPNPES